MRAAEQGKFANGKEGEYGSLRNIGKDNRLQIRFVLTINAFAIYLLRKEKKKYGLLTI